MAEATRWRIGTEPLVPADDAALRENNFNSLRLLFALLVIWSHCFAFAFGTEAGEPLSRLLGGTYNSGNIGVLAFFAISGFLITHSWLRSSSWRSYLAKRFNRIYPGYLVAVTLCSVIVVPFFSSHGPAYLGVSELLPLASNVFLNNYIVPSDAFGDGTINGSLWSIGYEFRCYLGVLALGMLGLLRRPALIAALAALTMLTRFWLDVSGKRPAFGALEVVLGYPYFWTDVLPPFLLGALVLLCRRKLARSARLLALLIASTLIAAYLPIMSAWRGAIAHLLMPATLVYALFYISFHPRIRLGNAARYGDFSYGTYLYAFPVQRIIWELGNYDLPFAVFVVSSMIASLLCGIASWFLVERWFEASRKRPARPLDAEAALVAP